jgi:hypothetical protein
MFDRALSHAHRVSYCGAEKSPVPENNRL